MYTKWTWVLVLLTIGGIFLLASSCVFQAARPNRAAVEEGGVTYSIETDRSAYALGETVRIVYRITNTSARVLDLGSVPDCEYCTHQLSITQNNKDIWQSCRVMPPCGFKEFRLDPNASWEYSIDWHMLNDQQTLAPEDDVLVDPGVYHLSAELNSFSDQKRIPVSVSVKITRSMTAAHVAPATKIRRHIGLSDGAHLFLSRAISFFFFSKHAQNCRRNPVVIGAEPVFNPFHIRLRENSGA